MSGNSPCKLENSWECHSGMFWWGLIHCRRKQACFISKGDPDSQTLLETPQHLSIPVYFSNWRTQRNSSAILTQIILCFKTEIWRLWDRKWFIMPRNPRSAPAPQWFQASILHLYQDKTKPVLLEKLGNKIGW